MPSRSTHIKAGMISGAASVFYFSHIEKKPLVSVAELIGGIAGGYLGGRIPDLIDPSKIGGPNHRSHGHGLAQNSMLILWVYDNIKDFRKKCFDKATDLELQSQEFTEEAKSFLAKLKASFWRIVSGLVIGLIAGIISHLFLDSFTKKGLPIFYNKF